MITGYFWNVWITYICCLEPGIICGDNLCKIKANMSFVSDTEGTQ